MLVEALRILRSPHRTMGDALHDVPSPNTTFLSSVAPLAAIRPLAALVGSILVSAPLPGFVLALGYFAMQSGFWLILSLALPTLVRQFRGEITDRQAFALVSYASAPLWLAGIVYVVPEDPPIVFLWSRLIVGLLALYGLLIAHHGFVTLGVRRSMRLPLLTAFGIGAVTVYAILSTLIGVGATLVLFVIS